MATTDEPQRLMAACTGPFGIQAQCAKATSHPTKTTQHLVKTSHDRSFGVRERTTEIHRELHNNSTPTSHPLQPSTTTYYYRRRQNDQNCHRESGPGPHSQRPASSPLPLRPRYSCHYASSLHCRLSSPRPHLPTLP
ncbi:hypothetical protein CC79DRAFT_526309 [Sarocladium strictum]